MTNVQPKFPLVLRNCKRLRPKFDSEAKIVFNAFVCTYFCTGIYGVYVWMCMTMVTLAQLIRYIVCISEKCINIHSFTEFESRKRHQNYGLNWKSTKYSSEAINIARNNTKIRYMCVNEIWAALFISIANAPFELLVRMRECCVESSQYRSRKH